MKRISVVGAGYVGTSIATLLGQNNKVNLIDVDLEKVNLVNKKLSPIKDQLIEEYLRDGKSSVKATSELSSVFNETDLYILALPTNYDPDQNFFNTQVLESVVNEILSVEKSTPILIKSTVPVGFTEYLRNKFKNDLIIFSPEFLREGHALEDSLFPSRIVIGDKSKIAKDIVHLFKSHAKNAPQSFYMEPREAESVKLFSNSYLALRVAYFNELDTFAMKFNLDAENVINAVSADPRIGQGYNNPSFGYGGYCLPKDSKQLLANYSDVPQNIISAIVDSNSSRKDAIADDISKKSNGTIGIYRLIMKDNSDNIRESSIQGIMRRLSEKGTNLILFEPLLSKNEFSGIKVYKNLDIFKKDSSIIVANRIDKNILDVKEKVYTRDIFEIN